MNIQALSEGFGLAAAKNQSLSAENTGSDTNGSLATATGESEEFNTFLELLTAQIKNQDPLAPLDSTQFVEQLATFTNLELQAEGNALLEDIAFMLAVQTQNDTTVPETDQAETPPEDTPDDV